MLNPAFWLLVLVVVDRNGIAFATEKLGIDCENSWESSITRTRIDSKKSKILAKKRRNVKGIMTIQSSDANDYNCMFRFPKIISVFFEMKMKWISASKTKWCRLFANTLRACVHVFTWFVCMCQYVRKKKWKGFEWNWNVLCWARNRQVCMSVEQMSKLKWFGSVYRILFAFLFDYCCLYFLILYFIIWFTQHKWHRDSSVARTKCVYVSLTFSTVKMRDDLAEVLPWHLLPFADSISCECLKMHSLPQRFSVNKPNRSVNRDGSICLLTCKTAFHIWCFHTTMQTSPGMHCEWDRVIKCTLGYGTQNHWWWK